MLLASLDYDRAEVRAALDDIAGALPVVRLRHPPLLLGGVERLRAGVDGLGELLGRRGWGRQLVGSAPSGANNLFVLSFAFDQMHARAAIYLEDDIQPRLDMLAFFGRAIEAVERDANVSARVLGIVANIGAKGCGPGKLCQVANFGPHGYALLGRHWARLRAGWTSWQNWDYLSLIHI